MKIVESIENYKKRISEQTAKGKTLASNIAQEAQLDKYVKLQRYEVFVSKISELYRSEKRYEKNLRKRMS